MTPPPPIDHLDHPLCRGRRGPSRPRRPPWGSSPAPRTCRGLDPRAPHASRGRDATADGGPGAQNAHRGNRGRSRLRGTRPKTFAVFPKEFKGCVATLTPLVLVRIQVPQPTKPRKSQRKSSKPPGRRLQNGRGVCSLVLEPFRRMQTKEGLGFAVASRALGTQVAASSSIANAGRDLALARRYGPRGGQQGAERCPSRGLGVRSNFTTCRSAGPPASCHDRSLGKGESISAQRTKRPWLLAAEGVCSRERICRNRRERLIPRKVARRPAAYPRHSQRLRCVPRSRRPLQPRIVRQGTRRIEPGGLFFHRPQSVESSGCLQQLP
jgi:hypothetical protein